MKSKAVPTFLIPLLVLLIARCTFAKQPGAKHDLTIVYTNDVQGEIEPCG